MKTATELKSLLQTIDRKSYPAYKDTRGSYRFPQYILTIDHVQGDPFASPSHVTLTVPGKTAGFPKEYYSERHRRIALEDRLIRRFHRTAEKYSHEAKGSGKSGAIVTCAPGQEVIERSACSIDENTGDIHYRLEIGFPANGRTINSRELIKILYDFLPASAADALIYRPQIAKEIEKTIFLSDDQEYIRSSLKKLKLCAFIADGSVLPRLSGISQLPMKDAKAFKSPDSLKVRLELPHFGAIEGMGIGQGITLIVGGGYHGKSTLLQALERGVYNHIAGDGREYIATDDTAMKIRSEDGRSVRSVDISLFMHDLPDGRDTTSFSTLDASGSTSQAANVMEALESGSKLLLIDEDTCATNFMIRDELMQKVIHEDAEPITPFIEYVGSMWKNSGISTILVAGSFGAFFHIADSIIQMDRYAPKDITEKAKKEAEAYPLSIKLREEKIPVMKRFPRLSRTLDLRDRIKTKVLGRDGFSINHETVELRYVEQIVDSGQSAALCRALLYCGRHFFDGKTTLTEAVDRLMELLQSEGLKLLCENSYLVTGLTLPRKQEILASLNRCRFLEIK